MKYALFLGCTVPIRAQNYELSARGVAKSLGIELIDVEDFSCCGFPVKSADYKTATLIAARNLAIASELGLNICTLCSACTSVLTETNMKLSNDISFARETNRELEKIGRRFNHSVRVRHFVRILYEEIGVDAIKQHIKRELSTWKLAAHHGCHFLKPKEIYEGFNDSEDPKALGELIKVTGANLVQYERESLCCGGAILGVDENISLTMAGEKLKNVKEVGADGLILMCPFCNVMYDDNQRKIGEKFNTDFDIPIMYYPQILGLALGFDPRDLGFRINKVRVDKLFAKLEQVH
ncbi:MAG TPA: CoB--CoM heterodisulfide reductase subunit B [bacterium (Candidatus Stahlbacteria)]|nr:CoB--CoM heterodisulfide reductase subunit B [Candidatus Stahlbacteria bacterium]